MRSHHELHHLQRILSGLKQAQHRLVEAEQAGLKRISFLDTQSALEDAISEMRYEIRERRDRT